MSQRFDTAEAALEYLTSTTDYERMRRVRYNADTFNLDRMTRLAEALGRPDRSVRSVHIAGTKGKGSTAAMIEAILRRHGLRTGLYTSPHLVDLRERIQIDRHWIDADLLRRSVGRVADAVDERVAAKDPAFDLVPTFFEMFTAVAFCAFAEAGVDVAVLEVGLGGRLDATNIVTPEATVITPISLDHVHQLGGDLKTIAGEKAGIVKPEVPLVLAPQPPEVSDVILAVAAQKDAPVVRIGADVTFRWRKETAGDRPGGSVTVRTQRETYADCLLPLAGRVQAVNAACAVAAAERVVDAAQMSVELVRDALAHLDWPGRMQTFPGDVTVILDGAHNADSLAKLTQAVDEYYPAQPVAVVFGSAADKDIDGMVRVLAEWRKPVVFTRTANPRAAEPEDLADRLRAMGEEPRAAIDEPQQALADARAVVDGHGVVVVCGSLYLVGTVLEHPERFGLPARDSVSL